MIEIKNKEMCCGCSACAAICPQNCISMVGDRLGFLYPTVDLERCVNCGMCESCCPTFNAKQYSLNGTCQTFVALGKDVSVRRNSSSGGIFYLISRYIIGQGGVVFGASFDSTFHYVKHIAAESLDEIKNLMGSKYVQSDVGTAYKDVKKYLEYGRKVLFTGTPCQISGLKSYLKKDWPNLFLLDIVCHGVPSPAVWSDYVGFFENKYSGKVVNISFRNKENGWKNYLFSLKLDNGYTYAIDHSQDLYMRGFLHNYFLRSSCYNCLYKGIQRESDLTMADCWGVEKICSELDDQQGTSLIIVTSAKGKQLFEAIASEIFYFRTDIECVLPFNRSIVESAPKNEKREEFEQNFRRKPIQPLLKKYCSISMMTKIKRKIEVLLK